MHGHCATVLVVAWCSATVTGQAAHVLIVAGRSATIGTVVENVGVIINILCLLLSLSVSLLIDNNQENSKLCRFNFFSKRHH
jgi:hypothetical protein